MILTTWLKWTSLLDPDLFLLDPFLLNPLSLDPLSLIPLSLVPLLLDPLSFDPLLLGLLLLYPLSLGPLSLDPRYCVLPPTPMALFTGHWSCQLSELPAFNVSCPLLDNILCDIRLLASCKNTKTEYAQFCWVNVNHSKQPCKDLDC